MTRGSLLILCVALATLSLSTTGVFAQEPATASAPDTPPKPDAAPQDAPQDAPLPEREKGELPRGANPPVVPLEDENSPRQILNRISEKLREVEATMARLSFGEGAGDGQRQVVREIDKLLRDAGDEQQAVIGEIDKLIDMARRQCKSGSFSPQQLDQSSSSQQQPSQQEPQSPDQRDPHSSDPQGKEPNDGQQNASDTSKQRADSKPQDPAGEKRWNEDVGGRWGNLPPKLQELIRQGDPSKFPPQYREMLEEYYKRLSDQDK